MTLPDIEPKFCKRKFNSIGIYVSYVYIRMLTRGTG